jgi:hypothetical protein
MAKMGRRNHKLGRVLTPDETLAAMDAREEYAGITAEEKQRALDFALQNMAASQAAKLMQGSVWTRPGR